MNKNEKAKKNAGMLRSTVVVSLAALLLHCSMAFAPGDKNMYPIPRLPSILPLAPGNRWVYSFSDYDSSGTVKRFDRQPYTEEIHGLYGLTPDSQIVAITGENHDRKYLDYIYKLEGEQYGYGVLISYWDTTRIHQRGLYLVGEYTGETMTLYDTPRLWLAYPAFKGTSWELDRGQGISTMTVVSTEEPFYFPDNSTPSASALRFYRCYLYKESRGDTTEYSYYHSSVGLLGSLIYINGKRRVSRILTSVSLQ